MTVGSYPVGTRQHIRLHIILFDNFSISPPVHASILPTDQGFFRFVFITAMSFDGRLVMSWIADTNDVKHH